MKKSSIKEVNFDSNYLISKDIDKANYTDNFRLTSEKLEHLPEPKDLMIAFFLSFPRSFKTLLHTREFIAKFLNLKTASATDKSSRLEKLYGFKGNIGEKIALFEVLDKTENELLTGQNDSHLDFKLSFISFGGKNNANLELATTVILNNTVGKIYFALVKPFHRFYLKRILRQMEKELIQKTW